MERMGLMVLVVLQETMVPQVLVANMDTMAAMVEKEVRKNIQFN
jgi:hypothetical protein